ncbi:MAG: GAF domain-containing protein, partial [Chloroflexota bacterium]|nr:GAF domain-containing protein [Chloroflexota bacterium]
MSQAIPASTRQFRGKLARTTLPTLFLTLVSIVIVGSVAYFGAKDLLKKQSFAQLVTIEKNLESQIDTWIGERHILLYHTVNESQLSSTIEHFISLDEQDPTFDSVGEEILTGLDLANSQRPQPPFNYFAIVDKDGEILTASFSDWVGETIEAEPFFTSLSTKTVQSEIAYRLHPFEASDIIIITAVPIFAENTSYSGAVVAITRENDLRTFLQTAQIYPASRAYFVNTDEIYLGVSKLLQNVVRIEPSEKQKQTLNAGIKEVRESGEGYPQADYLSFNSEPVLGTYTWIQEINSGFVVEVPTVTVYARLNNLLPIAAGLLGVTILITGLLFWQRIQHIVQPLTEITTAAQHFSEGDWHKRADVTRNDEIGFLAHSFNQMANELSSLHRSLEFQVNERAKQIRTAAEVAKIATSTTNLDELLRQTVRLIVERFDYYHAAIYLLDKTKDNAVLKESFSAADTDTLKPGLTISLASRSIISHVSSNNQHYIANDISADPLYIPSTNLPDTQSEAVIPLSVGDNVLGILDVQGNQLNIFKPDKVITLGMLANQIASALQNMRLLEATRTDLQATAALCQASYKITEANSAKNILEALSDILKQSPFTHAFYQVELNSLHSISTVDPSEEKVLSPDQQIPINTQKLANAFRSSSSITIMGNERVDGIPASLMRILQQLGDQAFSFFPIMPNDKLKALVILGSVDPSRFTPTNLEPYSNLTKITRTALEKVAALETIQHQLTELESLNAVSRSIATETDINTLYKIIHQQINQMLGEVHFFIALYKPESDTIEIPYIEDGTQNASIAPFPLGKGLTSIVIRSNQPLML